MTDRASSPAYAALPQSARRVFAAIASSIGDGSSASLSYTSFGLDHHISLKDIAPAVKLLSHLGLIEVESGPRLVHVFRLSHRWCSIDELEAVRLAAMARELKPRRIIEKEREPKPVKLPKPPKPMRVARPRRMQRRVPSLPAMPWQNDGR